MISKLKKFRRDNRGQALVEYAVIIALISIIAVVSLGNVGRSINDKFEELTVGITPEDPNVAMFKYRMRMSELDGGISYDIEGFDHEYIERERGGIYPTKLVIPSEYNGSPIANIDSYAFFDYDIQSVTFPEGVGTSDRSFRYYGMTYPLTGTWNLKEEVWVPAGQEYATIEPFLYEPYSGGYGLDGWVIKGVNSEYFQYDYPKDLIIPRSYRGKPVVEIGENAFTGYNRPEYRLLTDVTIPESVKVIGTGAFSHNKLQSVIIPASIIHWTDSHLAFSHNRLTTVTYLGDTGSIWPNTFTNNGPNGDSTAHIEPINGSYRGTWRLVGNEWVRD